MTDRQSLPPEIPEQFKGHCSHTSGLQQRQRRNCDFALVQLFILEREAHRQRERRSTVDLDLDLKHRTYFQVSVHESCLSRTVCTPGQCFVSYGLILVLFQGTVPQNSIDIVVVQLNQREPLLTGKVGHLLWGSRVGKRGVHETLNLIGCLMAVIPHCGLESSAG